MDAAELESFLKSIGIDYVRNSGHNLIACCPFHAERNPSWGISTQEPHPYGCFGCGASGTLLNLLLHCGWPLEKARKFLKLHEDTKPLPTFSEEELFYWAAKKEAAFKIDPVDLYPYVLDKKARRYLSERGISKAVMGKAEVTYYPQKKRILFPWYAGKTLVGCTGRYIGRNPDAAKTLPLFNAQKGHTIYLPSRRIRRSPLILVEGEIDALKVFTAGFRNVGALAHGVLTRQQIKVIMGSAADELICFFDDDEAGRRLTLKVAEVFAGKKKLSKVLYKKFRSENSDKLDPAALSLKGIRHALKRCLHRNYDMVTL